MLFRVCFWDDRNDREVYGKTVEAKSESEAEDVFFDSLDEENDYREEYPILVKDDERTIANIEIEIYTKKGKNFVYLSNDGSSGVKQEFTSNEELKKIVADYVEDAYLYNIK